MKFLIAVLFGFLSLTSVGQNRVELNNNCIQAYQDILSLRFEDASQLLASETTSNPQNVYVDYLENYIDFLSVFITEDEALFHTLEDNKAKRVERIKNMDEDSPFRDYMLGNIQLQWAVARLKFGEYFTAAWEINKAYRLLKTNSERFPDFVPNNLTLGILHIIIGLVPQQYHWILEIINMEGSVGQGKAELKKVLQHTMENKQHAYLKNEVLFYLGFTELNVFPDEKELDFLLAQLEAEERNNLLLSYLSINILMRTGNNDKVLQKFKQLPEGSSYFPFYYLNYLHAECHLRKLNIRQAAKGYASFVEKFKGQNYIKDAYRKMAWAHLLMGDTLHYNRLLVEAASNGDENVGLDADAQREAEVGKIPETSLIKARLLFDGGYYQQSDSVLKTLDTSVLSKTQLTELNYRKARIAHQLNNPEIAKFYYTATIVLGKDSPRYFAGNAALKLAEMYELEMVYDSATFYYKLCLDLDFDEYRMGIHSKAKAGLNRLTDE